VNGYYKLLVALLEGNGSKVTIVPFHCPSRHTANAILKNLKIEHKF
jgi:hypothetical protein